MRTSRQQRYSGYWRTWWVYGNEQNGVKSYFVMWTLGCSGNSPMAEYMPPISQMHLAPCCSTSMRWIGMTNYCDFLTFRVLCCRRFTPRLTFLVIPRRGFPLPEEPGTSRQACL